MRVLQLRTSLYEQSNGCNFIITFRILIINFPSSPIYNVLSCSSYEPSRLVSLIVDATLQSPSWAGICQERWNRLIRSYMVDMGILSHNMKSQSEAFQAFQSMAISIDTLKWSYILRMKKLLSNWTLLPSLTLLKSEMFRQNICSRCGIPTATV